ncbi:MAG: NAD-glutamate dehydrogenase domain-containing protein, partial [Pseudomonadota bacterium]
MANTSLSLLPEANLMSSMLDQMRAFSDRDQAVRFSDEDLVVLSKDFLDWAKTTSMASVRLRPGVGSNGSPLGTHIVEVTGPDRPFLVDSLLGAIRDLSFEVLALFHPILGTNRETRQSLIQIHLPPLTVSEQTELSEEIDATLKDVIAATDDYRRMRQRMAQSVEQLHGCPHIIDHQRDEAIAFLEWLGREHFVFLGVRDYTFHRDENGDLLPEEPEMIEGSNLGLLKDENRNVLNRGAEPLVINRDIGEFLSEPEPLILAKATLRSRVHRRVDCDYIGVKSFDKNGRIIGETRYLGLYTSEAYNRSVRDIPLIRKRVTRVIEASGALKGTHNEKALSNIMERWPRDEMFQMKAERMAPIILGALNLIARPRVRLFVRPDRFGRFVSAVVFVPREAYDTTLREKMTEALEDAYQGRLVAFQPSFEGASLVRVLFAIALPHEAPEPDVNAIEAQLVAMSRTWNERFQKAVEDSDLETGLRSAAGLFTGAFNAAYREEFTPNEALRDVEGLSDVTADAPVKLRAYRRVDDNDKTIRAKIYTRDGSIALSDCVPVFERMGLFVDFETGYPVKPRGKPVSDAPDIYWIHDLLMRRQDERDIDLDDISEAFEEAFVGIWSGLAENDGFNQLIFNAGLNWREAALIRALCAYRHQSGLDPARETQIEALNTYPELTCQLVDFFHARLQPGDQDIDARQTELTERSDAIQTALVDVKALDHDRVLRRLADLIPAIQRTSYYQTQFSGSPLPYIAVKVASRELDDLPDP